MSAYTFSLSCPRCGGDVAHQVTGRPTDLGMRATAVVRCTRNSCHRTWQIITELVTCGAPPPEPAPLKEMA